MTMTTKVFDNRAQSKFRGRGRFSNSGSQGPRSRTRFDNQNFDTRNFDTKSYASNLDNKSISSNSPFFHNKVVCQICGKPALDCYHRANFSYQGRMSSPKLSAMTASTPNSSLTTDWWIIDSGATNHLTYDLSNHTLAQELDGTNRVGIAIGNGQGLSISHVG
ncbi:L-galactonolactone dehydrogenase [Sarracenia purpurea var. burkii]